MKYAILIHESPADFAARTDPERAPAYWAAFTAYSRALVEAGVIASGAGLQPPATATTVRLRDGVRVVQDGPFVDAHEQLGGFFVLDVASHEEALAWAARCPAAATGGVEVRPVLPPPAL